MIYIRRLFQSSNIFILCSLLLTVAFTFHCRILYQAYQKRLRLYEYNEAINDMRQNMEIMENVVNKTEYLLNHLKKVIKVRGKRQIGRIRSRKK